MVGAPFSAVSPNSKAEVEGARPAEPADVDALVALVAAEHAELTIQRGGPLWAAHARVATTDRLSAALADDHGLVLAGTIDDVVLGVATARLVEAPGVGTIAVIDDLYVDPDAREVGIGHALITQIASWANAQGCVGVDATVLPGNRAAKNFFEAHGLVARAISVHRAFETGGAQ